MRFTKSPNWDDRRGYRPTELPHSHQAGTADPIALRSGVSPFEVTEELRQERTPSRVRDWLAFPPPWLTMMTPGPRIIAGTGLHRGELAAMDLAKRLGNQTILIDDQRGKSEAVRRGLPVIGTIGLLYQASLAGLVDFEQQLNALLKTNFHVSATLTAQYLALWKARE